MEYKLKANTSCRIDSFLVEKTSLTRNQIIKSIKSSGVLINNKLINKPSFIIKINDDIVFNYEIENSNIIEKPDKYVNINYIYKDKYLAIINKARGIVVHPSSGHQNDTLVNYLFEQDDNYSFSDISSTRPGIVHRIDKDTQGLLIVAYDIKTMELLQKQIQDRIIHREYLAIVKGKVKDKYFKVDAPLTKPNHSMRKALIDINNGKDAITHFKLISQNNNYSFLSCKLETGRTHQIRAHLAYLNYPILGDNLYGGKEKGFDEGQCLCAYKISFIHPHTNKEMFFYAPVDEYFKSALRYVFKN